MKKHLCLILLITLISSVCYAADFKDVPKYGYDYEAICYLSENGIISGYTDGNFKPENTITRAEAASVIVRAAGIADNNASDSRYSDVKNKHWARKHIMIATDEGILSGTGNGKFNPDGKVTYNEIIKMVVCMTGMESDAKSRGGWPNGYVEVAYGKNYINEYTYRNITKFNFGKKEITRSMVAQIVYNALISEKLETLNIKGNVYQLGMAEASLGTPDEKLASTHGFTWYVYGTDTYKDFVAVGVSN